MTATPTVEDVLAKTRAELALAETDLAAVREELDDARAGFATAYGELAAVREELGKVRGENAGLRAVLKKHHDWHLAFGDVSAPDLKGGYITWDLSEAYTEGTLCDETVAALAGGDEVVTETLAVPPWHTKAPAEIRQLIAKAICGGRGGTPGDCVSCDGETHHVTILDPKLKEYQSGKKNQFVRIETPCEFAHYADMIHSFLEEQGYVIRPKAGGDNKVGDVVEAQANDEALWAETKYISEAYLQQELRRLHAVIEGISPEEHARRTLARLGGEGR